MKTPATLYNEIPIAARMRIDVELSVVYARAKFSLQALESRVAVLTINKGQRRAHKEVHASKLEIARTLFSAELSQYKPFIESETDLAGFMRDRAQAVCNWIKIDPITDGDQLISEVPSRNTIPTQTQPPQGRSKKCASRKRLPKPR